MPKIIGLTGQSGAGKSTVSQMFAKQGCHSIDTDKVARAVVEPGKPALTEITKHFGTGVLKEDGTLNRPTLATIVFSDPAELDKLNRITHKYITEEVKKQIASCGKDVVIVDAPALFESGIDAMCDFVVSVLAEEEIRIQRIMKRDALSREKAEERIRAQKDDDFFRSRSDFVLENNGFPDALEEIVRGILKNVRM